MIGNTKTLTVCLLALVVCRGGYAQHQDSRPASAPAAGDWQEAESPFLANHVQLTFPDQFVKAGEAYFSPDDKRVIFQAIEMPHGQTPADEFYAMYVADVVYDAEGRITGLDRTRQISPPGSANTCGWFHPTDSNRVLFASTIVPPSESKPPGYQRASGRYRWMFPPEMTIVTATLDDDALTPLIEADGAYVAECSWSNDGRYLLYCSLASNMGDILVYDTQTGDTTQLVSASGYDGGPFFAPDGQRICYRSDRRNDHLLQLFVSELEVQDDGTIVGTDREYQLTNNQHVNWCPFWHPDGRHLVYATSEAGHHNYEIFLIDADPGDLQGADGPIRYGSGKQRITHAGGADVLPAFNSDGSAMIWTSKRGPSDTSQLWVADFTLPTEVPSDQ